MSTLIQADRQYKGHTKVSMR